MSDKIYFQLTMLSQNDLGCDAGDKFTGEVKGFTGGTMLSDSSPVNEPIHLPIPPAPDNPNPPTPPTWFMEVENGMENASYSVQVVNPEGPTTNIEIKGADMAKWVEQNDEDKTNQVYLESACGIFGYAQMHITESGKYWIYTITAGVNHPVIHSA